MSKKVAVASVLCLVLGGVAIPGGMVINNFITDLTYGSVDEGLLGIKDQAIPLIEPMVKEMGVSEALRRILEAGVPAVNDLIEEIGPAMTLSIIRDVGGPAVEDMIKQIGPAMTLSIIRDVGAPAVEDMIRQIGPAIALSQIVDQSIPYIEEIVNASFLTQVLYNAYVIANNTYGEVWGGGSLLNMFFDYYSYNLGAFGGGWTDFSLQLQGNGLPPIKSISHWYGENLEIGWGNLGVIFAPEPWPNPYIAWGNGSSTPGFIQDPEIGWGVLEFLADVEEADGNPELQDAMLARYNYTWDPVNYAQLLLFSDEWWKFKAVYDYYYEYWVPEAIPMLIDEFKDNTSVLYSMMPEFYNMDTKDIAYYYFLEQWANCSMFEGGVDFHTVVEEIPEGTYGLEVNRPNSSGIPLNACYALWDKNNIHSFLNLTGILEWYAANSSTASPEYGMLLDEFDDYGLNETHMAMILNWLWAPGGFSDTLLPILVNTSKPFGYGVPIDELAIQILYEQWSNVTALGLDLYSTGMDFGDLIEGIDPGTTGFEAGLPNPLNLTIEECEALWDETNELALTNIDGILVWHAANSSPLNQTTLLNEFTFLNQDQLDAILGWLWDPGRFADDLIPKLVQAPKPYGYGVPIDELAIQILYEQWSNVTALGLDLYSTGMDFGDLIEGIDPGTTGFEAGLPNPLNLTIEECEALWDETNELALTNIDGILVWHAANSSSLNQTTLLNEFTFLSQDQLNAILDWLWGPGRFVDELLPKLVQAPKPYGYGVSIEELAEILLYEQWANGTTMGMVLYPEGIDFNELIGGFEGPVVGFEVGVPSPTNLTLQQCQALWNMSNSNSLLDMMEGIPLWVDAKDDPSTRQDLIDSFGLSSQQMDMILKWLWGSGGFSDYLVPILIESDLGYGIPMEEFCFHLLLEQWANGTVMGQALYPGGFPLPLIGGPKVGFEVGIPVSTGMSLESALALWNVSNHFSLVSKPGLTKWFTAVAEDTDAYNELKTVNGLTDLAMGRILTWLPLFQQNVMPYLAQHQYSLPTDSISLGNTIQIAGIALGGSLIGLAAIGLTGNVVAKRRRVTKSSSKSVLKLAKTISEQESLDDIIEDRSTENPDNINNSDNDTINPNNS